jgi:hypothetical protein
LGPKEDADIYDRKTHRMLKALAKVIDGVPKVKALKSVTRPGTKSLPAARSISSAPQSTKEVVTRLVSMTQERLMNIFVRLVVGAITGILTGKRWRSKGA